LIALHELVDKRELFSRVLLPASNKKAEDIQPSAFTHATAHCCN